MAENVEELYNVRIDQRTSISLSVCRYVRYISYWLELAQLSKNFLEMTRVGKVITNWRVLYVHHISSLIIDKRSSKRCILHSQRRVGIGFTCREYCSFIYLSNATLTGSNAFRWRLSKTCSASPRKCAKPCYSMMIKPCATYNEVNRKIICDRNRNALRHCGKYNRVWQRPWTRCNPLSSRNHLLFELWRRAFRGSWATAIYHRLFCRPKRRHSDA